MRAITGRPRFHLVGCARFWAWALVGAGLMLGCLAIFSVGILILAAAVFVAYRLARRQPVRGTFGLLSGAGTILLLMAYLNRSGPGEICSRTATSISCGQQWNPIPWLVAGLVFFAAGLAGHAWRSRY